jgi:hypothetical protein
MSEMLTAKRITRGLRMTSLIGDINICKYMYKLMSIHITMLMYINIIGE